ncbi:PhaM family polyhydroxyalkanoate granule multifunctional regulatory protein [Ramlibacter cellulosilyticus]|uniref:PhaM family polyhydroxyalkanoate granule multifunctional regulatory protein n=1 Tax=Ramlibacter cellulosilyticus TaxID=2764187 RepID=UPI0021067F2F|nr:PhaM family polyhydroxyalkanoate granule multifunctional regulatory protein [Ramlibacter cellulosilyticus]
MNDNTNFGFAKLVPGFDFLQNLAKGASQTIPQLPNLSNWVAPTLNVEELEKRIGELKAVHFWLDQNSKALGATIQALEVQKMTLATLQGMNFNMGDVANALKLKTAETVSSGVQKAATAAGTVAGVAGAARRKVAGEKEKEKEKGNGGAAPVDPLQWWGALTQQFQEIAANAMKDAAQKTVVHAAKNMAAGAAKEKPAKKGSARKAPARKKAPATS